MDNEGMKTIEKNFNLDDPETDFQSVFEFINNNGLTSKLKIPKSENTDL